MMKFSTASYSSPIFAGNRHQRRKTKLDSQQQNQINNEQNQQPTKNTISSKIKTGALVTSAILAGFGIGNINSCSNQKENLNKQQIEQITKENTDSIKTQPEKVFVVKDSLIQNTSIENNDNKEEIKKEKKAKTQTTKPKAQKTQPKEKVHNQSNKTQSEEMDEGTEVLLELMMFGE